MLILQQERLYLQWGVGGLFAVFNNLCHRLCQALIQLKIIANFEEGSGTREAEWIQYIE